MTKVRIRQKYLAERNNLTKREVVTKSAQIFKHVSKLPVLEDAKKISIYLPINNEVETRGIIDDLVSKGKKVFLPKYAVWNTSKVGSDSFEVNEDTAYSFAEFTGWDNLEKGPFGILQPTLIDTPGVSLAGPDHTPGVKLDVVFLPGVAFDKHGVRLGYGKGVFDRLLSKSKAVKIGLAYDFQVVGELPREKHDLVTDIIVTEKRMLVTSH